MELEGKIKLIGEIQEFGSNGFRKRDLVIDTEGDYPQSILIEFVQDKCELLDGYKLGLAVKVDINIRGREWVNPQGEVKYFNSIQGWRISKIDTTSEGLENAKQVIDSAFEPAVDVKETNDDLPF